MSSTARRIGWLLAFVVAPAGSATAQSWYKQTVDAGGSSGWTLIVDSDSQQRPQTAFYTSGAGGGLTYVRRELGEWVHSTPVALADAFALDAQDLPYFVTTPAPDYYPQFQVMLDNGLLLGQQLLAGRVSDDVSIHFDSANRPHVGFVDTAAQQLKHAYWTGSQWTTQVVASGPEFQYANWGVVSAMDPAGQVHFAWQAPSPSSALKYAKPVAGTWQVTAPFSTTNARPFDMTIDGAGNLHLAYDVSTGNLNTGGLFYGKYNGTTWSGGRVDGLLNFGAGRSQIVVDPDGTPHIFTYDSAFTGPEFLKHLRLQGGTWQSETIDQYTSTSSGPEAIAAIRDERGYHVIYSTSAKNIYYAYQSFNPLPGDFSRDGHVGADDVAPWRAAFGQTAGADANGDGATDGLDMLLWQRNAQFAPPTPPPPVNLLVNGDFGAGSLAPWSNVVTPNGNVSAGYPRIELFDVDGDGEASSAMAIRVGATTVTPTSPPAGGGIQQTFNVPSVGDYLLTADIASTNLDTTGNTAPGRFELILDGTVRDFVDMLGTTISPGQTLRDQLSAAVSNLSAGSHSLQLLVTRPATNSRAIYQYIDDVVVAPSAISVASAAKAPEPRSAILAAVAGALALRTTRRGSYGGSRRRSVQ